MCSFNTLNMNIGANYADYSLLLPKGNEDDGTKPFNEVYENFKKGEVDSEVFFDMLANRQNLRNEIKPEHHLEILKLLLENGPDILEDRFDELQEILDLNDDKREYISNFIRERITDSHGTQAFETQFPKLTAYLRNHFEDTLPIIEGVQPPKMSKWQKIKKKFNEIFKLKKPENPIFKERNYSKDFPRASTFQRKLQEIKDRLTDNFFKQLIHSPQKPAVINLQEVYNSNRNIMEWLSEEGYAVFQRERTNKQNEKFYGDTAIAIDTKQFTDISSLDMDNIDSPDKFTFVKATHKKSKEEFIFVSIHMPGYGLEFPETTTANEMEQAQSNMASSIEGSVFHSAKQLGDCFKKLKEAFPQAKIIVQGDFNTNPDLFDPAKHDWVNRTIEDLNIFKLLKENSNLELHRTEAPTERNMLADKFFDREIDFALTDNDLEGRFHLVDEEELPFELRLVDVDENKKIHLDPHALPSDHRPLFGKVERKMK